MGKTKRISTAKGGGLLLLAGAVGLAGCGLNNAAQQAVAPQPSQGWEQSRLNDFAALASDSAGREVAVLTGSVVDGRGAGELNTVSGIRRATNIAFDVHGTQPVVIESGQNNLTVAADPSGKVTGSGTVIGADGQPVAVTISGKSTPRSDEAIPDSEKCGLLDEKLLVVGSPSGPAYDKLASKMTVDRLASDGDLSALIDNWGSYDALIVDDATLGSMTNTAPVNLFLQGSKWVVVTNPGKKVSKQLTELMPISSNSFPKNVPAVAVRAGDPGGSWNQAYQTVPLYKSSADPAGLDDFVQQLHKQGDTCVAVPANQANLNEQQAQADPAVATGEVKIQHAAMVSEGANGPVVSQVAVPAYSDQHTDSAAEPLTLPANSYGFSHTMYVDAEHKLPGSRSVAAHPNCTTDGYPRYETALNSRILRSPTIEKIDSCPKEWRVQKATVSGTEDVLVLLTADTPPEYGNRKKDEDKFRTPSSSPDTPHVNLRWTVLHQQNVVANASELQNEYGTHALAYSGQNGSIYHGGEAWGNHSYPLRELGWLLTRADTDVELGKMPDGAAGFVPKNASSFPLKTITNANESKSISGSWSVNAGGGTFAAVPIMNIGGSYSKSWSHDVSASVPSWTIKPSFEKSRVNVAWETHSTTTEAVTNAPLTERQSFQNYQDDKIDKIGYNELNVSGLTTNSVYAWQSSCAFGKVPVTIKRNLYFANVHDKMPVRTDSYWATAFSGWTKNDPKAKDLTEVQVRTSTDHWALPTAKYDINLDDPAIAIYPKHPSGFKGLTPDGKPVIYDIAGCSSYPVPKEIKDAVAEEQRKQKEAAEAAKAEEERKQKAAAAREQADQRYTEREKCNKLAGAKRQDCLRKLEDEDDE